MTTYKRLASLALSALFIAPALAQAPDETKTAWSLQKCLDYARENNISLKQSKAAEERAAVDRREAKAAWWPTLNFSTSQSLQYRPFQESATGFVNGTSTSFSADKVTQSGNYGLNASWTVWNGRRRTYDIKDAELAEQSASAATEISQLSLQEQITQLYIQILYSQKALELNEQLLESDIALFERGQEMLKAGQISKSDLSSLETNVAMGRFDVVNAQSQITTYLTSLKQLLELAPEEQLYIQDVVLEHEKLASQLPDKMEVYQAALDSRPEIKQLHLAAQQSQFATKRARAAYQPTINLTASLGDNHVSGSDRNFWQQMKTGFAANVGISLNIPLLDGRGTRSNIERARINEFNASLDLQDGQKQLWADIENHWTSAYNQQQKYSAATVSVESAQTSYDYMKEAFRLGTKNIVDLTQARTTLLRAENDKLQAKYLTLLYRSLLELYFQSKL